ncbi:glutaredoxin family protein [Thioalkalivibrio sp. XN8]|uniref:glutaredoxin family protein n=1 Tax=Thioalkalivibrio sp. XN8 TaxID=2712863 RepID=UPI0013EC3A2B|nr:glutaredoxin family protein [Thioalkalivibrio sp. XN8]NGP52817.1 glutaredoxin family protein [Thioalkalivibrio sp. XN8]
MSAAGLVIYTRRDCSLCEQMEAAVREVAGAGAEVALVDIDDSPALSARFGRDVPVLCLDGEVVCKHFLDPERLRAALGQPPA